MDIETYEDLERYAVCCWACHSQTFFDYDEALPDAARCWRCGEIINGDL